MESVDWELGKAHRTRREVRFRSEPGSSPCRPTLGMYLQR